MKKGLYFYLCGLLAVLFIVACGPKKDLEPELELSDISKTEQQAFNQTEGDTITIGEDDTEYQIIIIEPGFDFWLASTARPEGYYSQNFLESRNWIFVSEWNRRVIQPWQYPGTLYQLEINYQPNIDYGYEVNYKLYNYFIYFQRKYKQRLGPFVPRI